MRFGPDCKRVAQNFRAGNPRELPKTVAKRQKVCYNHKKDCPRPFAGLWAAVLFGKSLKERGEHHAAYESPTALHSFFHFPGGIIVPKFQRHCRLNNGGASFFGLGSSVGGRKTHE